jgi:hypothetical protein
MGVYVDPQSGDEYDVDDSEDGLADAKRFGLVPQAEFQKKSEYESLPLADRIADTAQGFVEGATRPLEAIRDFGVEHLGLPSGRDPYKEHALASSGQTAYSPSSPEALERPTRARRSARSVTRLPPRSGRSFQRPSQRAAWAALRESPAESSPVPP